MFATIGHVLFGNLFIGAGEGGLLWLIFKTPLRRSILWMIAANYLSAIVGFMAIGGATAMVQPDIYNVRPLIVWAVAASFVATIVVEWPFTWLILKGKTRRIAKALLASVIVQTASYGVLVPWYVTASDANLLTQAHVERSLAFVKNKSAVVYYIVPQGNALARVRLDGSPSETIMTVDSSGEDARLFAAKQAGAVMSDLYIARWNGTGDGDRKLLMPAFAPAAAAPDYGDYDIPFPMGYHIPAADLRPKNERDWEFETHDGFQAPLVGYYKKGGGIRIEMDSPVLEWRVSSITALPGDEVVFQLGDQIVILDRESMKLALVARGTAPLVVLDSGDKPSGGREDIAPLTSEEGKT